MKILESKPHIFLWISVPVILLLGLSDPLESIDIKIYDSYFIATPWGLALLLSLYFALLGLLYWSMIKSGLKPVRGFTLTHLICTIDVSFFIWLILFFNWFTETELPFLTHLSNQGRFVLIGAGLFVLGQIVFVLNVFLTLALHKSAKLG